MAGIPFLKWNVHECMGARFKEAAEGPLKGILGYSERQLVSMDFKGDPRSAIVEAEYCLVQDGTLAKLVAWYDNEWGYSCRVADLAKLIKDMWV
jgi:glyceraldehyde 3-phosphate dehydrogenase